MKKAVAILLSLALMIGICSFAVYAVNQYSEKIYQYNTILSDSSDSDLINAIIYYDNLAISKDELEQIVYERCGYTTANNYGFDVPVFYLSQEDKKKWREADNLHRETLNQLNRELGYEAAKPVLDYVGIELVLNGKFYYCNGEQVTSISQTGMRLWLTKAQILKASEMDYVIKIVCYDPNWTPQDDYTDPSGTMPLATQNSATAEPTTEKGNQSLLGDVNGDNDVNVLDAVDIQKYSSDNLVFTDEQKHIGDYNKDGVCDILDATAIQTALVK